VHRQATRLLKFLNEAGNKEVIILKQKKNFLQPDSVLKQINEADSIERCLELVGSHLWMKSLRQSHDGHFKRVITLRPHAKGGNPVNRVHFSRYQEMSVYEKRHAAATTVNLAFQLSNMIGVHGLTDWFIEHIKGSDLQKFARREFSRSRVLEAEKALIQRIADVKPGISEVVQDLLKIHDRGPSENFWEWSVVKERNAQFGEKLQELKMLLPSISLDGWSPELWVESEQKAPIIIEGKSVYQVVRKGAAFGGTRFERLNCLDDTYGLSNKRPAIFIEAIHMESALHALLPLEGEKSWYEMARKEFFTSFSDGAPDQFTLFEVIKNKRRKLIAHLSVISALCKEEWQSLQAPFADGTYRLHRLPEVKYFFLNARIMRILSLNDDPELRRVWLLNELPLDENSPKIFSLTEEVLTAALLDPNPEKFLMDYVMRYLEILSQDIIQYGPEHIDEKSRNHLFEGMRSEAWMEDQAELSRIKLRQAFAILEEGRKWDFSRQDLIKQNIF